MLNRTTEADARNRAVRTLLQFLVIEVLVTVLPLVMDALEGTDPIDAGSLARACIRAALGAVLAYVMRRALPPSETPPPVSAVGTE